MYAHQESSLLIAELRDTITKQKFIIQTLLAQSDAQDFERGISPVKPSIQLKIEVDTPQYISHQNMIDQDPSTSEKLSNSPNESSLSSYSGKQGIIRQNGFKTSHRDGNTKCIRRLVIRSHLTLNELERD